MSGSLLRSCNAVKIVGKTHLFPYASSSSIANGSFAQISSSSSGCGKHSMVPFQSFSAVASAEEGVSTKQDSNTPQQPRALPTRHSRHHAPPVAPVQVLDEEHDRIVSSIPGTLLGK